jgi:uncharacterized membrane protein
LKAGDDVLKLHTDEKRRKYLEMVLIIYSFIILFIFIFYLIPHINTKDLYGFGWCCECAVLCRS